MAAKFDPYHQWLSIPPEEQPADHYRLLGLKQFESDPDVISSAADRQMAHVRSFQSGQHALISQTLLNEISAARVCLLNPGKKADYDSALRAEVARKQAVSPSPQHEDAFDGVCLGDFARSAQSSQSRGKGKQFIPATIAVGAALFLVIGIGAWLLSGNNKKVALETQGVGPQPSTPTKPVPVAAKEPTPTVDKKTEVAVDRPTPVSQNVEPTIEPSPSKVVVEANPKAPAKPEPERDIGLPEPPVSVPQHPMPEQTKIEPEPKESQSDPASEAGKQSQKPEAVQPPKDEQQQVKRVIRFTTKKLATDNFVFGKAPTDPSVLNGEGWTVQRGVLLIQRPTLAYYNERFSSMSSVTIHGTVVPPTNTGFRFSVGPISAILNWEMKGENHFRNGKTATATITVPPALAPGKLHTIRVEQAGEEAVVSIDGKEHFRTKAILRGVIAFHTSSKLGIRDVVIEGVVDSTQEATIPDNLY